MGYVLAIFNFSGTHPKKQEKISLDTFHTALVYDELIGLYTLFDTVQACCYRFEKFKDPEFAEIYRSFTNAQFAEKCKFSGKSDK